MCRFIFLIVLFTSCVEAVFHASNDYRTIDEYVDKEYPRLQVLAEQCGVKTLFLGHTFPDNREVAVIKLTAARIGKDYVDEYDKLFTKDPVRAESYLQKGISWLALSELLCSEEAYGTILHIARLRLYHVQSPVIMTPLKEVVQSYCQQSRYFCDDPRYKKPKEARRLSELGRSPDVDRRWDSVKQFLHLPVEPTAEERIQTLLDSIKEHSNAGAHVNKEMPRTHAEGEAKSPHGEEHPFLRKRHGRF